jgi:hypothetical protein
MNFPKRIEALNKNFQLPSVDSPQAAACCAVHKPSTNIVPRNLYFFQRNITWRQLAEVRPSVNICWMEECQTARLNTEFRNRRLPLFSFLHAFLLLPGRGSSVVSITNLDRQSDHNIIKRSSQHYLKPQGNVSIASLKAMSPCINKGQVIKIVLL